MLFITIFLNILFLTSTLNAECIIKDNVELRKNPSLKAPVTWKVRQYFPVKKIAETKYWMKVMDLEKGRHWIQKDLL
ncbi:MAG: SH3 domain-containing protein, partial [bacterium]